MKKLRHFRSFSPNSRYVSTARRVIAAPPTADLPAEGGRQYCLELEHEHLTRSELQVFIKSHAAAGQHVACLLCLSDNFGIALNR